MSFYRRACRGPHDPHRRKPPSVPREVHQGVERQPGFAQPRGAAQLGQIDDGGTFGHRGAQPLQQSAPGHHGAAGGDEVVDQQDPVAGLDRVGMQLDRGAAVFQFVGFLDRGERQLALLADGHEAHVELVGHDGAEDEAARVQARDHVGTQGPVHVAVHEGIDEHAEHLRVLQQRGDVAELHARRGPVGHGADVLAEVFVDAEVLHDGGGKRGGPRRERGGKKGGSLEPAAAPGVPGQAGAGGFSRAAARLPPAPGPWGDRR